ncbi:hypothetical protein [Eoetvoesiella caeni]|uniref:Secreted protein n=1 Tax=Eoetvoesiella caeni TaxID=645616 RepID=A0A366GZT8_9BURK|nr:hypothetical protein DFR37_1255 [Eoetvoesiella caeni]
MNKRLFLHGTVAAVAVAVSGLYAPSVAAADDTFKVPHLADDRPVRLDGPAD